MCRTFPTADQPAADPPTTDRRPPTRRPADPGPACSFGTDGVTVAGDGPATARRRGSGETNDMPVTISCPQLYDAALRTRLHDAVAAVIKRARPSFEAWKFSLFQSQSGAGWDLAISGPRFRKVFTLYGPADDLPGLVSAYVDAIITHRE